MRTFDINGYVPVVADVLLMAADGLTHVRLLFHNAKLNASFTELACNELATGVDASSLESALLSRTITCLACAAWSDQQYAPTKATSSST